MFVDIYRVPNAVQLMIIRRFRMSVPLARQNLSASVRLIVNTAPVNYRVQLVNSYKLAVLTMLTERSAAVIGGHPCADEVPNLVVLQCRV